MPTIVRAKRLGWNEGPTGNVTRTDILDPYDYTDDNLEGEHVTKHVQNQGIGPYTLHLVGGQVADPETIVVVRSTPDLGAATARPATLLSSGGVDVTAAAVENEAVTTAPTTDATQPLGGKPNQGTKKDKRLKQNHMAADAPAMDPAEMPEPQWRGVLVVENSPTGDGREFAPDAIEWADMPLPLRWQKVDSHGGMATNETVRVGNITRVWRDGSNIMGEGFFDTEQPDGAEAYRRMMANTLNGVSIDADDITDADIEYIFPETDGDTDEEDDIFFLLFAMPEKILFHSARIRAATLCDIPAFVEAQLHCIDPAEALVAGAAVIDTTHTTATTDGPWDGPANEQRLPVDLPLGVALAAYAYVEHRDEYGNDVPVLKMDARLLHHEVSDAGEPGAANITACASGLQLAKTRHEYEHLARHLRDAGQEPPPYVQPTPALVAHAWGDDDTWRPPRDWFSDPHLGQLMPIIVTEQGRVYGHAAQWGQCHLGYMSECVMAPHEDYHAYYLTGEVLCEDGSRVAVGQITAGIEHAPMQLRASSAKQHYENTDAVVADVITGNDQHGIWVAGAIRPWAQASRVAALRGSGQVSPDWRRIGGELRMVALLTVNTSGYTVPRARALMAGGEMQTLISSGMIAVQNHGPTEEELNQRALRLMQEQLAARVHGKVS